MNMEEQSQKPHAILVAYPLQGHVNPTVYLAINLASRGLTITFVNTHSIHHQITSKAQQDNGSGAGEEDIFSAARKSGLDIRYTTVSDGLPVGFDRSLNHDQFMACLLHVFSAHVEEVVENLVKSPGSDPPVNCLIADTFFVFPGKLAKKYGLYFVSFWTEPALIFSLYYHIDLLKKNCHFGCNDISEDAIDYIPGVKSIQFKDLTSYLQEANNDTVCHQIIFNAFHDVRLADFVLCNTVEELESETIYALKSKIPFWAIGPIFPDGFSKAPVATSLWSETNCDWWLEGKPNGSVLYVSFGSYAHVKKSALTEMAYGLSQSGVSFIWVLRPDIVSSLDADPLPIGYKEEIKNRGMIIPWCSQKQVLANPATGGFLTHCGWNSILESIWCEVPLLCFPLYTDQFTNRKLVVDDWKAGLNLCGSCHEKKILTRNEVSRKINLLMDKKSGELKEAIKKVKKTAETAIIKDGSSDKNVDQFIKDLKAKIKRN